MHTSADSARPAEFLHALGTATTKGPELTESAEVDSNHWTPVLRTELLSLSSIRADAIAGEGIAPSFAAYETADQLLIHPAGFEVATS